MEEKNIESAPALTKEEIAVFYELRKMDQAAGDSSIKMSPQPHLEILINRRWKFEKHQDGKITDFEQIVHEESGFSAKAYAAELYNNNAAGINYKKMNHVPYPDLDLSIDEVNAKLAGTSSTKNDQGKQ